MSQRIAPQKLSAAYLSAAVAVFTSSLAAHPARAEDRVADCAREPDDRLRLLCYDRAIGRQVAVPVSLAPAPVAPVPVTATPVLADDSGKVSSVLAKTWELGAEDKRGAFVVRTYLPNFVLPAHYTSSINRAPSSPTHAATAAQTDYRQVEAKLQVSLRTKVAENLLLPGADLWFAYTQRSLWQVWDRNDSSPFRSTDYQPEAIYVIPVPAAVGQLPFGWNWRMLQLGMAHTSNGQSGLLSRSWNRVYVGAGLDRGDFGVLLKLNQRLREYSKDDNPDLINYVGRGEISAFWLPGRSTLGLTWRTNLTDVKRGSLQMDWTHPVFADRPTGLRWYAQFFSGYGETLLDYNHRQNRFGVGLTLFQF